MNTSSHVLDKKRKINSFSEGKFTWYEVCSWCFAAIYSTSCT